MTQIKCITFDKAAQDNLPQHIKDRMKADKAKAIKEQQSKDFNISDVINSVCICGSKKFFQCADTDNIYCKNCGKQFTN